MTVTLALTTELRMQDQTAAHELRNLQALALSLQGIIPEHVDVNSAGSEDEQVARQLQQLDALDSELAAFERRFASADPEVKRMLAQMLSQDGTDSDMLMYGNDAPSEPCLPVATPTSSDSAQTFPTAGGQQVPHHSAISRPSGSDVGGPSRSAMPVTSAQGAQQCRRSSACLPSGTWQTPMNEQGHQAPDRPMAADVDMEPCGPTACGEFASTAMFPAVTPANSLAQQAVHRDTLSDCAASLPMPTSNPSVRNCLFQLGHGVPVYICASP